MRLLTNEFVTLHHPIDENNKLLFKSLIFYVKLGTITMLLFRTT